jgi:hypothetical protein
MAQDPGLISGIPDVINGTISDAQPPALQTQFAGNTVTASQDFPFYWNGQIVQFWANETAEVAPDLMAALIAQGAPVTTP